MPEKVQREIASHEVIFWGFQALLGGLGAIACTFLWWIFGEVHAQGVSQAEINQRLANTQAMQDRIIEFNKGMRTTVESHEVRITVLEKKDDGS